ncbi:hypothetical protein M9H77_09460 [Catharanthus roseus]|uniref:Uncharacterized protein n=1 Tax=Catharanthus roseus TaxID=4058 RepID=A0ACC0C0U3_CATRO|nr:hypothetical protein M9H77_09460 [Catharanthus roseus]
MSIKQQSNPLGCAINRNILNNQAYQNWFTSRFKYTVFENEMKWYSTEPTNGREDYSVPDAMLRLVKQRNIIVRGHSVFWDDPNFNPSCVRTLSPTQLSSAVNKRINSVLGRYKGQLIHWDVANENIHFGFLEQKLGPLESGKLYKQANLIDNRAIPFCRPFGPTSSQYFLSFSSPILSFYNSMMIGLSWRVGFFYLVKRCPGRSGPATRAARW